MCASEQPITLAHLLAPKLCLHTMQAAHREASGNSEQHQVVCLPLTRSCSSLGLSLKTCAGTHLQPSLEEEVPSDLLAQFQVPVPVYHVHHLSVHVNISLPGLWPPAHLGPVGFQMPQNNFYKENCL